MFTYIKEIITEYSFIIIIAELVIILLLLFWRFLFSVDKSEEIESLKETNKNLEKSNEKLKEQVAKQKREINVQKTKIEKYESESYLVSNSEEKNKQLHIMEDTKATVIEFDLSQENDTPTTASQIHYQYLQEANAGKFMKILPSPEKCYFRTWENEGVRKYEFHGNVAKALANINAIFDDVCDIEGKRAGATDIENVSPGVLDVDLKIVNKAQIRLK